MADENLTLKESIEAAQEQQNEAVSKDTPVETKVEPATQETKIEDTIDPEITEAINFYNALKDPNKQKEIITGLALRAGLIKADDLNPKEEKRYGQLLDEILGEEYPDLKNKLSPVLIALQKENDAKLLALKAEMDQERVAKATQEFETEFSTFLKENKVTEEEAGKMIKEIQELPPSVGKNGKRIPLTQYLSKIYKLVSTEKKIVENEVKRVEKINQNLKERSTQLTSDVGDDRLKKGSRLPTIREAVSAAAQGIAFDE